MSSYISSTMSAKKKPSFKRKEEEEAMVVTIDKTSIKNPITKTLTTVFFFVFSLFVSVSATSKSSWYRMSPKSARKAAPRKSLLSVKSSGVSSKAISKEYGKIDNLFDSYANKSSGVIEPEGIESLCSDLGVDHTDVRILMLAWKMNAETQGYFTKDEWRRGLKALKADTLKKLKNALPELEQEVHTPPNFVVYYSFAFRYCLTEEKQKTIDVESICVLLNLVLGSLFRPQVDSFVKFLQIQNEYRAINMDQWMGILRFCNEISFPDVQNYDSDAAWPLILDNFVQWISENQS